MKSAKFRYAYYQQMLDDALPLDATSLEHIKQQNEEFGNLLKLNDSQAYRSHLAQFGLQGDVVTVKIGSLSGGQRRKLVLALLMLKAPQILLFDEPTNNLDMDTIQAIGTAIKEYKGTVIVASHDMAFLETAVDIIYHVQRGAVHRLEGGIKEYEVIARKTI